MQKHFLETPLDPSIQKLLENMFEDENDKFVCAVRSSAVSEDGSSSSSAGQYESVLVLNIFLLDFFFSNIHFFYRVCNQKKNCWKL